MTALAVGTVLALLSLAFVLYPIFSTPEHTSNVGAGLPAPTGRDDAIAALREVEFDRATGKLSEADYSALKAAYTRDALAGMRAESREGPSDKESPVLEYRARAPVCSRCGPRPEADAAYCSSCGRYLAGACGRCGTAVTEIGARYCATCGGSLAA